jgi:hypothetical protein
MNTGSRRFWLALMIGGLTMAIALPASATKPGKPVKPNGGMTCAELSAYWDFAVPVWNEAHTAFTVTGPLNACVDVDSVQGVWQIDVDMGSALEVYLSVQDSAYVGDTCWGRTTVTESGTVYTSVIPAATLNACGTGEADGAASLTFNAQYLHRGKLRTPATITVTLP